MKELLVVSGFTRDSLLIAFSPLSPVQDLVDFSVTFCLFPGTHSHKNHKGGREGNSAFV